MLAIGMLATLAGCEQTVDVDLPYEERIVILNYLGRDVDSLVYISKTVPIGVDPSPAAAALDDAEVLLSIDGAAPVRLERHLPLPGAYRVPQPELLVGHRLRLMVNALGRTAWSETVVPANVEILGHRIDERPSRWNPGGTERHWMVHVRTPPGTVAWATLYGDYYTASPYATYLYGARDERDRQPDGTVLIDAGEVNTAGPDDMVAVIVNVADEALLRYLDRPHGDNQDPFGFGGVNPYTNVEGDGVGLLVGIRRIVDITRQPAP